MYLQTCTRPDLAYAASLLSRFMADGAHRRKHWVAAKRVLRYLQGTKDHGVVLGGEAELRLQVEADSSWADDAGDRKSSQGYIATLGSGPIDWKSQKSGNVATSTAEAEYYAAGAGAREVIYLRELLMSLGHPLTGPTPLWCDNQAAVAITHNPEFHARTKHIGIAHHFIRDEVAKGVISVQYIPTEENRADLMTKALGDHLHAYFTNQLLMRSCSTFNVP
jgi:hypothetical protein